MEGWPSRTSSQVAQIRSLGLHMAGSLVAVKGNTGRCEHGERESDMISPTSNLDRVGDTV